MDVLLLHLGCQGCAWGGGMCLCLGEVLATA
jgi:hypothetical protein